MTSPATGRSASSAAAAVSPLQLSLPAAAGVSRRPGQGPILSGRWTALARGDRVASLEWPIEGPIEGPIEAPGAGPVTAGAADGAQIEALDTAGAWLLQRLLATLGGEAGCLGLTGLPPEFMRLMAQVQAQDALRSAAPPPAAPPGLPGLQRLGRAALAQGRELWAALDFVGACALAAGGWLRQPRRVRWLPILFNIRSAGVDALPIVGLLSFLLGAVVSYQSADQLRQYGAGIFIVDIVGVSMLREFAPLIAAIIVAGRSGSAYAAQIGTMAVTEEIDAMQTLGIAPIDMLVLPKVAALLVALPLLTGFADALGVAGGMVMARSQLDVGYGQFLSRFVHAVGVGTALVGIAKAVVFAAIIVMVGCYRGFCTRGGADDVGRQTTRSVVAATFLVIVADALFSVVFSRLGL